MDHSRPAGADWKTRQDREFTKCLSKLASPSPSSLKMHFSLFTKTIDVPLTCQRPVTGMLSVAESVSSTSMSSCSISGPAQCAWSHSRQRECVVSAPPGESASGFLWLATRRGLAAGDRAHPGWTLRAQPSRCRSRGREGCSSFPPAYPVSAVRQRKWQAGQAA